MMTLEEAFKELNKIDDDSLNESDIYDDVCDRPTPQEFEDYTKENLPKYIDVVYDKIAHSFKVWDTRNKPYLLGTIKAAGTFNDLLDKIRELID